jgi:hypothetical protein
MLARYLSKGLAGTYDLVARHWLNRAAALGIAKANDEICYYNVRLDDGSGQLRCYLSQRWRNKAREWIFFQYPP